MEHCKEIDKEITFRGTGSNLTVNSEKLNYPKQVANGFNNIFITNTDKIEY